MLPNFLIIGAQKAGTSSLCRYLRDHPQVFMSRPKEPDFFVEERAWARGLSWYSSLFEGAGNAVAVGEASACYTMDPLYAGVPERIADTIADVRLVYLIREPIERIGSEYLHLRSLPRSLPKIEPETLPIERALRERPQYVWSSRYAHQIERYLEHFPRERLLVILSEDLKGRRIETLRTVFEFIGVDPGYTPMNIGEEFNRTDAVPVRSPRANRLRRFPAYRLTVGALPASVKRTVGLRLGLLELGEARTSKGIITEDLRTHLGKLLREDVARLRAYMGPEFNGWGIA